MSNDPKMIVVSWREKLNALLKLGFTNQGHKWSLPVDTSSRPSRRRTAFVRRNRELVEKYGYNLPRRVRRRIAWESVGAR